MCESVVGRVVTAWLGLVLAQIASQVAGAAEKEAGGEPLEEVIIYGARPTEAGPLPGLLIGRDQIPGNIQSAGRQQIEESGALSLGDFMNSQLQGVSVNDYSGNPFKMDVNYRGFTASPEIGTPVGLSVFFDGVRVNEPFGDVVNWDLLPLIALERFDLFPGSNPIFGLNTLGGALSLRSRSGFTSPGYEGELSSGSWNRRQVEASAGVNNGTFGGFAAAQYFDEDGWRDDSPSKVRQLFLRGDWRGSRASAFASALVADNELIGNGLIPTDLYRQRRSAVFTSPDETRNKLSQFTLNGTLDVSDAWNVTAQVYRRDSERTGVNGDIYEGFDDFTTERDLARTGLIKVNPNLPWCQVANLNGGGTPDGVNPILNGPAGTNCSIGNYTSQIPRNGGSRGASSSPNDPPSLTGTGPGVVDGSPIGLLSKIRLDQVTDGAAVQSNWNLEQHHFMVGAAFDRSRSGYEMRQRLGLIDANHHVYEDPDAIDPIYRAAQVDIVGNKFDGTSRTTSLYFSETWSPLENVHLTASARYNHSVVDSRLLTRTAEGSSRLDQIRNRNVVFPVYVVCPTTDPASCPAEPQPIVFDFNGNAANQTLTTDLFEYNSFNPQVGLNWLPVKEVNLFGNISYGARVPSVVELGCAFDSTPVPIMIGPEGNQIQIGSRPRSLTGPTCNLPTTLSGDPYLPQIHSRSAEIGARGRLRDRWRWNVSAYRTDLRDDIYFVGVADGRSYFDTIDKTRRVGLEAGFAGEIGQFELAVGYSYVDATFQSTFYAASPHNSSADFDQNSIPAWGVILGQTLLPSATANDNRGYGTYRMIRIDPGARLPGIPAHNGNATLTWRPTDAWRISLTMIAHSLSYVRGNENNQHRTGGTDQETGLYVCQYALCEQNLVRAGRPFTEEGKTGGFAVFNLNTSFKITKQLSLFAQVNNIFDKDYQTAGRLGITPFSPSTYGAIGPSGWNYNSSEWQNSTFVGPGAPRGAWIGIRYQHDAR